MPFSSPNYTQTPNDLFDEYLKDMGEAELKVMLVIIRNTFGYHRNQVEMSLANIARISGLTENNVASGAKAAEEKGLIERITQDARPRPATIWKIKLKNEEVVPPLQGYENDLYPRNRGMDTPVAGVLINKEIKELKETQESSQQKIPRTSEDVKAEIVTSMINGARAHASLTDIGNFPPDISDFIQEVCDLWHLRPPSRKPEKSGWIEQGRALRESCGEFGVAAVKEYRKDYEAYMASHGGVAPHTVCGPSSLVNMVRAKAAKMREGSQVKPVDDGLLRAGVGNLPYTGIYAGWVYQDGIKTDQPAPVGYTPY